MPKTALSAGYARESARSRELYRYYQPTVQNLSPSHPSLPAQGSSPSSNLSPSAAPSSTPTPSFCDPTALTASPDPVLAAFSLLLANLLNAKRCMISLIDSRTQYIVAESTRTLSLTHPHTHDPGDGLWLGGNEKLDRSRGLCVNTILLEPETGGEMFEIRDLSLDERFMGKPFVTGWPGLRFYCGVPLRTENGINIGSLCVVDDRPRPGGLREEERETMRKMAGTVMGYLELVKGRGDVERGRKMEEGLSRFMGGEDVCGSAGTATKKRRRENRRESTQGGYGRETEGATPGGLGLLSGAGPPQRAPNSEAAVEPPSIRTIPTIVPLPSPGLALPGGEHLHVEDVSHRSNGLLTPSVSPPATSIPTPTFPVPPASPVPTSATPSPATNLPTKHAPPLPQMKTHLSTHSPINTSPSSPSIPFPAPSSGLSPLQQDENSIYRHTFSRAAHLIRSALDLSGCLFLDADFADHNWSRGSRSGETSPESESESEGSREEGVFGSAGEGVEFGEMGGDVVRVLLRRWPRGRIFDYDLEEGDDTDMKEEGSESDSSTSASSPAAAATQPPRGKRKEEERRVKDVLRRFLPGSVRAIILPLYGPSGKPFALSFGWAASRSRIFTPTIELSYLTAFSHSIMAEISRLHTVSADKAKGDFISSISHELRSPLHGILASTEFLAETELDGFQRGWVETVESCGKTLLDTINHVLDFSKLNSLGVEWTGGGEVVNGTRKRGRRDTPLPQGEQKSNAQILTARADLAAITEEVVGSVFAGFEFKGLSAPGITEKFCVGDKEGLTVVVDVEAREEREGGWWFFTQPEAFRRILLNVTGNAVKYTEEGWVRVRLRARDLEEGRTLVMLTVSDSGRGIGREFLKTKLFTPFSQENPLMNGTGLGMSIVRKVLRMMGGTIDVKSQTGLGTVVKISLVLRQAVGPTGTSPSLLQVSGFPVYHPGPGAEGGLLEGLRERLVGRRVWMEGFGCEDGEEGQAHLEKAKRFLRGSLVRYCREWFGMVVVEEEGGVDTETFVLALYRKGVLERLERTKGGRSLVNTAGMKSGPPLVLLCSNKGRRDVCAAKSRGGVMEFCTKPCGPMKLARTLVSCLDRIESGADSSNNANEGSGPVISKIDGGVDERQYASVSPIRPSPLPPHFSQTHLVNRKILPPATAITETPPPTPPIITPPTAQPPPRVLVVDDNPVNLMLLTTFMIRKSLPYSSATNGLEAVRAFEAAESDGGQSGFDIVLMDLQMPVMGGLEATRLIRGVEKRSEGGKRRVKIVALTGLASGRDREEAFGVGVDLFLVKPVRLREVEEVCFGG